MISVASFVKRDTLLWSSFARSLDDCIGRRNLAVDRLNRLHRIDAQLPRKLHGGCPGKCRGSRSHVHPRATVAFIARVPQIVHCRIPVADLNSRYGTPCRRKSWSYRLHCMSGACRGLEQLPHCALSSQSSHPQRATVGVDERALLGRVNPLCPGFADRAACLVAPMVDSRSESGRLPVLKALRGS